MRQRTWAALCDRARVLEVGNVAAWAYNTVRLLCGGRGWAQTDERDWSAILEYLGDPT